MSAATAQPASSAATQGEKPRTRLAASSQGAATPSAASPPIVPAARPVPHGTAAAPAARAFAGVLALDPRTHLAAVALMGVAGVLVTRTLPTVGLQALACCYLALNGRLGLSARCAASFAAVWGLSYLPLPGLYGVLFVSMMHMVPAFTVGCALFTCPPSAIMCAFARWRVPERALVGVCMVFRFASVLAFETRSIARGIRMRGIFPGALDALLHPGLVYECLYTPLVMRCLRLSSELAASAELRGISAGCERTSTHRVGFSWRDAAAAVALALGCAALCAGGGLV